MFLAGTWWSAHYEEVPPLNTILVLMHLVFDVRGCIEGKRFGWLMSAVRGAGMTLVVLPSVFHKPEIPTSLQGVLAGGDRHRILAFVSTQGSSFARFW